MSDKAHILGRRPCENPACSNSHSNPRFCGRSCAAKLNNRATPKRRPQGKCANCSAEISSSKKLCESCKAAHAKRKADNLHVVIDLAGESVDYPLLRDVYVSPKQVFELRVPKQLTETDTCAEFVDQLIAILYAKPAYLRIEDLGRHITMLHDLRAFELKGFGLNRTNYTMKTLRLDCLTHALHHWLSDKIRNNDGHVLLASYALDTVSLVEAHAGGHSIYQDGVGMWGELPALIETWYSMNRVEVFNPRMKRHITERIDGHIAEIALPEGAVLKDRRGKEDILGPGIAYLKLYRCHLSRSFYEAEDTHEVTDPAAIPYDLGADFCFDGTLIPNHFVEALLRNENIVQELPRTHVSIPGSWVRATLSFDREHEPVPVWTDIG